MANRPEELLYPNDLKTISSAVEAARARTWIALQMHVEMSCSYPEARAQQLLRVLKVARTDRRDGVLFFLLVDERRCFVVVDERLRALESTRVWQDVMNHLTIDLRLGKIGQGMADAITRLSYILAGHYPRHVEGDDHPVNDARPRHFAAHAAGLTRR